jgi:hypothetical protein
VIVQVRTISGGRVDCELPDVDPEHVADMLRKSDFMVVRDVHTGQWRVLRCAAVESMAPATTPVAP